MSASRVVRRPIPAAFIGGGLGSVIGSTHRYALRLSERFDLVAGAFDVDAEQGRQFGRQLHLSDDRLYENVDKLIAGERLRDDPVELVCVLTPNHTHFEIARKLVEAGFHVMCEKPLTTRAHEADELVRLARTRGLVFAVMYGYTGYPMVRHAHDLVRTGVLGKIRIVQCEFSLGTPSTLKEERAGHWRTKRGLSGESAVIGMVGTHALYLATYVTGLELEQVSADIQTYVDGRELEDNAHLMLRFSQGATGMMWNSYVAAGIENGLRLRVFGELGGLEWSHENPNELQWRRPGEPRQTITLGTRFTTGISNGPSIAAVQPEGFIEAFANIYRDVAKVVESQGHEDSSSVTRFPSIEAGAIGVRFIAAAVESGKRNGAWTRL